MRVVAILETMWDWRTQTSSAGYTEAPRYFKINAKNHTGARLYKLIGPDARLYVTNACRELVSGPQHHGTPNPEWLAENLQLLDGTKTQELLPNITPWEVDGIADRGRMDLLLICGKVAQKTFRECGYVPRIARVIEIPHPAARAYWTREVIARTARAIQGGTT